MRKRLSLLCVLLLLCASLPAWADGEFSAYIKSSSAMIYSDAKLKTPAGSLKKNTIVTVLAYQSGVAKIQYKSRVGFARVSDLGKVSDIARKTTLARDSKVYSKASTKASYVTVPAGTEVYVLKVTGACAMIERGGKVGYIYIPDMGAEGLNEFARWYYPQLDKEALIIDDRGNGGGNISPMVIERLLRKVYRMTMYRNSNQNGTIPEGTHTGPKVLLINKYSASDGDLFPWSFKANNLGTVIGTRTWGGIVGISGSLPYMDGTDVRVPFFTNYDAATGQWIVENHGVDPDILLDNDPIKEYAGEDQQLDKAIETALRQLKDRKPLPATPAPRTFKDLGLPQIK